MGPGARWPGSPTTTQRVEKIRIGVSLASVAACLLASRSTPPGGLLLPPYSMAKVFGD